MPIKFSTLLAAVLLGVSLSVAAQQIYQSTDEQGNPTFSDQPAPDSEAIVIEKPNVSDPVPVPPPSPEPEPASEPKLEIDSVPDEVLTTEPKRSKNKKKRKKNKRKWRRRYDYEANPHF